MTELINLCIIPDMTEIPGGHTQAQDEGAQADHNDLDLDESLDTDVTESPEKRSPRSIFGTMRVPLTSAIVGGAIALVGGREFNQRVLSAPETISGTVASEPVIIPGVDEVLPNGIRVKVQPGVKVTLYVCKSSKTLDIDSGVETNNADCSQRTGFLTTAELTRSKINSPLTSGMKAKFNSSDFFSGANVELDR